ncbi:MAG: beta-N-acetylhexosaminidase [Ruminococcaceae bacterium]|nr:beta-N-acetylhexosaminidase [Oscillospiraceae bacterium]
MNQKIRIACKVPSELELGIERLSTVLQYELTEGEADLTVEAVAANRSGVVLKDGRATVYYARKSIFFRELGIAVEHARDASFEAMEDDTFQTVSVMIDTSRCAVPTVKTVNDMMDYLAVMGYNMAMLYTEDTIEVPGRPYFGYMRGRYTADELRAIDDYAFEYGIEVIPCLECYGHMERYLRWPEAASIKDTPSVLMARSEDTFAFVEEYIKTAVACFRSKRIHIGMDEAWNMGRGAFLTKHGYVPPFEIFTEYMERLISITNKYGLKPMMWSDMYFRACSPTERYYEADIEIPEEVVAKIPAEVELVFWHYGEKPYCDDYMLKKHKALNRNVIYCGGLWSWCGHFPENNYAMETMRFSLDACRKNDVRDAMTTIWLNDNAECDLYATLFGLSFFAELCYDKDASEEKLRARFETTTGGNWDAFYSMSFYHNTFGENDEYPSDHWQKRFLGKAFFWQDIMEGLYDGYLFEKPMSEHYAKAAALQKGYMDGGKWNYLYEYAYRAFDVLATKTLIAENLVPAYKNGDREMLARIAGELLPALKEKTVALHLVHKAAWFDKLKAFGWAGLDVRYGGLASRCDTAREQIERYLDGTDSVIEQLEEERLYKSLRPFDGYALLRV